MEKSVPPPVEGPSNGAGILVAPSGLKFRFSGYFIPIPFFAGVAASTGRMWAETVCNTVGFLPKTFHLC